MGASTTVTSRPSVPAMARRTNAQSSTVLQIGPILSMLQLRPIAPNLLTRPYVGLTPATPHLVLGDTMEPNVSVPIEKPTSPAAVADPEPADDPLEDCS